MSHIVVRYSTYLHMGQHLKDQSKYPAIVVYNDIHNLNTYDIKVRQLTAQPDDIK